MSILMGVQPWRVVTTALLLALVVAGSAQAGGDHEPLRNADLSKYCTNNLPASDPTVGTYTRTADPPDLAADWVTLCFYEAPGPPGALVPWPGNVSIYVGPNSCEPDPANPQLAPGLSTTYQLQVSASPLLLAHIGAIKDLIGKDASALGLVPCAGVTPPSANPCETRASSGHARRVTALSAGGKKKVCNRIVARTR